MGLHPVLVQASSLRAQNPKKIQKEERRREKIKLNYNPQLLPWNQASSWSFTREKMELLFDLRARSHPAPQILRPPGQEEDVQSAAGSSNSAIPALRGCSRARSAQDPGSQRAAVGGCTGAVPMSALGEGAQDDPGCTPIPEGAGHCAASALPPSHPQRCAGGCSCCSASALLSGAP